MNDTPKKLLLHICCAPCSIYPIRVLNEENIAVMGFFYRHNIHPFTECQKREETLKAYSETINLRVIYQKNYELERFLQSVVFREKDRCRFCYHDRLYAAAKVAKKGKFDAFSSTLLYSKFQNHKRIRDIGEAIGKQEGIPFITKTSGKDGKRVLRPPRNLICTDSSIAAASTVKKSATSIRKRLVQFRNDFNKLMLINGQQKELFMKFSNRIKSCFSS